MQLYAQLYRARKGGWELAITADQSLRNVLHVVKVSGKKEAREIAARHNAICWNF